ncbi:glycosyltransferase involved in cell wall biosynthesis [Nakamurella sp. UYEF19]|uniref:glycosyltransferase family 2 protein n=1 Tax=Nakamurella sp. UYEF19 TaxID=1756392 RepID=UPI003399EE9D
MPPYRSNRRPTVSVVVPARNEEKNIPFVLDGLPEGIDEVILVDGNSKDGTIEAARRARPDIVVLQQSRKGKGNALAAGFAAATGDYIVMIDADGSMDPGEIPAFVKALDDGAHYAKGTRFALGGGSDDISLLRDVGNKFLNGTTNLLFRTGYSDLCYGYNAFRRECLLAFALPNPHDTSVDTHWGDGFEIETMINVRVAKAKKLIQEVPSFEHPRRSGESNLRTFRDGTRVLMTILRERATRVRPALPGHAGVVDFGARTHAHQGFDGRGQQSEAV